MVTTCKKPDTRRAWIGRWPREYKALALIIEIEYQDPTVGVDERSETAVVCLITM